MKKQLLKLINEYQRRKNKNYGWGHFFFVKAENDFEFDCLFNFFINLNLWNQSILKIYSNVFNLSYNDYQITGVACFMIRPIPRGLIAMNFDEFIECIYGDEKFKKILDLSLETTKKYKIHFSQ